MVLYNDAHVHYGFHSDIKKNNWTSNANISFVTATGSNYMADNSKILALQGDSLKCLWWFDYDSTIPSECFGGKYHGAYTKKPLDTYVHGKQLDQLSGKVLLVHCGMYKNGCVSSNTSFHHAIKVAEQRPDIQVILAHMGGSTNPVIKDAIRHAKGDNIWFDTSGITNPLIIEYAVNHFDENRILFGSDIPWCSLRAMLYNVLDADITEEQKEKILYSNMLQLI